MNKAARPVSDSADRLETDTPASGRSGSNVSFCKAGPFATMTSGRVAAPPNGDAWVGSVSEVAYGIHGAGARGSHDLGLHGVDDRSRDEERLSRYERWGGPQPGNQPVPVPWRERPMQ